MSAHLMFHSSVADAGREFAEALGIPCSEDGPTERVDYLIRYGTFRKTAFRPAIAVLNSRTALRAKSNRIDQYNLLKAAGVSMPRFWTRAELNTLAAAAREFQPGTDNNPFIELAARPRPVTILGRTLTDGTTMRGRGITRYDLATPADLANVPAHDIYTQFIPKDHEFRVDIVRGQTRIRQMPNAEGVAWNARGEYIRPTVTVPTTVVPTALAALAATNLDFGAVDVVTKDGQAFALEVNSAPEMAYYTLQWYVEQFRPILNAPRPR